MKERVLTHRQRMGLLWLGAVSPLFQRLPGALAAAGELAWLSPLLALVPMGLLALLSRRLLAESEALGAALCRCLGHGVGRGLCLCYGLWAFVLCAAALRSGAERFRWAVFPESRATVLLLVMAALGLMAALGRPRSLGRMGEAVLPFLLLGLGLVLLPALTTVKPRHLLPGGSETLPPAAMGALAVTNTVSAALFASFLPAEGRGTKGDWLRTAAGWGLLGCLLCLATVGRLGPELAGELPYPFFVMLRDVGPRGLLERVEPLLCAQWVATDFVLTAVLLSAGGRCVARAVTGGEEKRRWSTIAGAVLALVLAWLGPEGLWAVLPVGNALGLFGGLTLALAVGRLRKRI